MPQRLLMLLGFVVCCLLDVSVDAFVFFLGWGVWGLFVIGFVCEIAFREKKISGSERHTTFVKVGLFVW